MFCANKFSQKYVLYIIRKKVNLANFSKDNFLHVSTFLCMKLKNGFY